MAETNTNQTDPQSNSQTSGNPVNQPVPEIDYEKLAGLVAGKQRVAEDTVLKNFFKQQGLSQDQMTQAISAYKEQQKANTPDVAAIQQENQQLKAQILQSRLNAEAMAQAAQLHIDPGVVPYLIKLADLSGAVDDKGGINTEAVTAALNQVLTDVPAFKQQKTNNLRNGFVPIGGDGGSAPQASDDVTRSRFGLPKKS